MQGDSAPPRLSDPGGGPVRPADRTVIALNALLLLSGRCLSSCPRGYPWRSYFAQKELRPEELPLDTAIC